LARAVALVKVMEGALGTAVEMVGAAVVVMAAVPGAAAHHQTEC